jgi:hypothetical protein
MTAECRLLLGAASGSRDGGRADGCQEGCLNRVTWRAVAAWRYSGGISSHQAMAMWGMEMSGGYTDDDLRPGVGRAV